MPGPQVPAIPDQGWYSWAQIDASPQITTLANWGATRAYRNAVPGGVLMSWGPIQFVVQPFNFDEMDHETGTDWAKKEIVGAAIYREWVGENDEMRHLRGKIFPYRIGGNTYLEIWDAYRRAGIPNLLMQGGNIGFNLGWFVCEKFTRNHTFISGEGLGQMIAFEAVMARVPVPNADDYVANYFSQVVTNTA